MEGDSTVVCGCVRLWYHVTHPIVHIFSLDCRVHWWLRLLHAHSSL